MVRPRDSSRLRGDFYKAARTLGDIEVVGKGPKAYAKRRVRKVAHRRANGALSRILRALGL
jgi:hypothetical protein